MPQQNASRPLQYSHQGRFASCDLQFLNLPGSWNLLGTEGLEEIL